MEGGRSLCPAGTLACGQICWKAETSQGLWSWLFQEQVSELTLLADEGPWAGRGALRGCPQGRVFWSPQGMGQLSFCRSALAPSLAPLLAWLRKEGSGWVYTQRSLVLAHLGCLTPGLAPSLRDPFGSFPEGVGREHRGPGLLGKAGGEAALLLCLQTHTRASSTAACRKPPCCSAAVTTRREDTARLPTAASCHPEHRLRPTALSTHCRHKPLVLSRQALCIPGVSVPRHDMIRKSTCTPVRQTHRLDR